MTKQIDDLMALAREWVQARTKDHGGSPQQDALRQALDAALNPCEPVAWRLWDDEPGGEPAWRYYDKSDFRNDVNPQDFFHSLVPLYTTPPAQTPMQKINIPPGMVAPLDVVYAEGWNAACEKFGNPVFEPTPALVIEVTKEVATPAQTKRLDSDESRLTPPPRLTDTAVEACVKAVENAFAWTGGHGEPPKPGPDAITNIIRSHFHVVKTPTRLSDEQISDIAISTPPNVHTYGRAIESAVRKQFGIE